jgi:hypothetical protein
MTPIELGEAYIEAWNRKDIGAITRLIHPQAHFKGPMAETSGRDAIVASIQRMFPIFRSIKIRSKFAKGDRAIFTYDFECMPPIGVGRVADQMRMEDGLIKDFELFFDARPFDKMSQG